MAGAAASLLGVIQFGCGALFGAVVGALLSTTIQPMAVFMGLGGILDDVAGGREELDLLLQRRELLRCRLRPDDLGRVAVERDAHRFVAARGRELTYQAEHGLVPQVYAVVRADRDDGALGTSDELLERGELHSRHSGQVATTTAGRSPVPRRS